VQIFKWSKEIADIYYVDFSMIKRVSTNYFLESVSILSYDIINKALSNLNVQILPTLKVREESNPTKGHGFELLPVSFSYLNESPII
jgi:hypothetical protein